MQRSCGRERRGEDAEHFRNQKEASVSAIKHIGIQGRGGELWPVEAPAVGPAQTTSPTGIHTPWRR